MWTAPGMIPSSHSSCSRTSSQTWSPASSRREPSVASISVDLRLDLVQELAIGGHWFKKYSAVLLAEVQRRRPLVLFPATLAAHAQVRDHRGCRGRRRRADGRADAGDAQYGADSRTRRRQGGRRSCSTSACAPTRRRSRCARPPISTTPARCAEAAPVFARYGSTEAAVGSALASWPSGFERLAALAARDRGSSLVQLHYGLGLYWRGDTPAAKAAWRLARRAQPDTLVRPARRGSPLPAVPARACRRSSRASSRRPRWRSCRRRSSSTTSARTRPTPGATSCSASPTSVSAGNSRRSASSSAPRGPEAEVARAVGRFDKADPSRTFSRLGPLAKRYPRSQSVRFHLGLCLLWLGSLNEAKKQLRLARDLGPGTPLGTEARRFLERLP